jgi:hypothetical protein
MKNVIIVGILATFSLVSLSQSTPTRKSAIPKSAVNKVRNGYLKYNQTTTIGQALEHTFSNGTWKSFTTAKGATIVEFDGAAPFGELNNGLRDCNSNLICAALNKKFNDFCNSPAGWDQPTKDYHIESDRLWAKVLEVRKQQSALNTSAADYGSKAHDLDEEQSQLQAKAINLHEPENTCLQNSAKQNADLPIPIAIQFSINHDGTFQFLASDTFTPEELFSKMYN